MKCAVNVNHNSQVSKKVKDYLSTSDGVVLL